MGADALCLLLGIVLNGSPDGYRRESLKQHYQENFNPVVALRIKQHITPTPTHTYTHTHMHTQSINMETGIFKQILQNIYDNTRSCLINWKAIP